MDPGAARSLRARFPGAVRGLALAAAVAALAVTAAGCASSAASARPGVISAIGAENEYAGVLSQIGGRDVPVSSILDNPNTHPHAFEASASVAREGRRGHSIVQNGA